MVIPFGRYGLFVWPMWLWPIWSVADMVQTLDVWSVCAAFFSMPSYLLAVRSVPKT